MPRKAPPFDERYIPEPMSGCFLWLDGVSRRGYGQLKYHGRDYGAHRFSWMLHRGDIPAGMCVLHKCDTPSCVNPDRERNAEEQVASQAKKTMWLSSPKHRCWPSALTPASSGKLHRTTVLDRSRFPGLEPGNAGRISSYLLRKLPPTPWLIDLPPAPP
jgi:hypothetical protein